MILYYLDASVWVKRYYEEVGTRRVEALFSGENLLGCSALGLVEVTAVLSRKHKAGEISREARDNRIGELERDWTTFVRIRVSDQIFARASRLASEFSLRGADAIHLASALSASESLAGSEHRLVLATCDRELARAAEASGFEVFDPEGLPKTQ
jgi:predicted nucleic acid-binding protein